MNKKTLPRLARIAIFAAIIVASASAFAASLEPIAPDVDGERGPLLQPINAPGDIQPAAAVPEPATWGMLALGAGLLAGVRRFRRK
jgi:PEP-CTERM motif-containing protein